MKNIPPWKWQLVGYLSLITIVVLLFIALVYGLDENGIRQQIQWSGRISFTLFCLAFSASGLHNSLKKSWTWWLRMNRKYIGISFAIVHLIHLLWVISLQIFYHPVFEMAATSSLVGGGIAYGFVVAMLLTSFDGIAKNIPRKYWNALHLTGGYWIWVIFFSTYIKRTDTEPIHWLGVATLVSVLLIRGNQLFRNYRIF